MNDKSLAVDQPEEDQDRFATQVRPHRTYTTVDISLNEEFFDPEVDTM